ncbi:helix-turn-helix transcriptional regulator [Hoyosella rhizosphaerae]|uniref:Transcriptional regulatory protein n=1 Tax=Hoyosella rhizosphaerae TaxID=1755582 RepID=A0A916XB14_9ACTN|nr:helix-turn-helix transcriptional regulator [Hoyosella rhizosphaerae]MBN4926328.1 helix-turn-helix transcriptional regulator [Hoyosella rhizosphaerae]GGC60202.1 putative transcriptional regulatory protein [Hoyosella rhizosphaerae]
MALLLREALGDSLRRVRMSQSRTLREVSSMARVSLGYLSEVERGRKEASSELLASICDALDVELADVLFDVSALLAGVSPDVHGRGPTAVDNNAATTQSSDGAARVVIAQPQSENVVVSPTGELVAA